MKFIFVIALSVFVMPDAGAQQLCWVKKDAMRNAKKTIPDFLSQHSIVGKNNLGTLYQLQQDNMQCLVPDTTGLRLMPNAVDRSYLLKVKPIPNAIAVHKNVRK